MAIVHWKCKYRSLIGFVQVKSTSVYYCRHFYRSAKKGPLSGLSYTFLANNYVMQHLSLNAFFISLPLVSSYTTAIIPRTFELVTQTQHLQLR